MLQNQLISEAKPVSEKNPLRGPEAQVVAKAHHLMEKIHNDAPQI